MTQMGFYYDAKKCSGCRACQIACKDRNDLPVGVLYRHVFTIETGSYPNPSGYNYSRTCNHCTDPQCVKNCPTGAMYKAEDGTVRHDDDRCIGCKMCVMSCPYGVPVYLEEKGITGKCDSCALIDRKANIMGDIIPLVIFTTLAGLAAGAYTTSAVLYPYEQQKKQWLFPVICILLLGIGLCATFTHLGQPLRFYYGMTNPTSMIAQESYWSIAFGCVMLIDVIVAKVKGKTPRAIRVLGAILAIGLMVVTGLVYAGCLNYEAWIGIGTVPEFVIGDIVMGMMLYLVICKIPIDTKSVPQAIIILQALLGVVTLILIVHFANIGLGVSIPLIVSLLLGPLVVSLLTIKRTALMEESERIRKNFLVILLLLSLISVVIARIAFYAAGIL